VAQENHSAEQEGGMMSRFRAFTKSIPTILLSIVVALTVWVMATTAADPSETRTYPNTVPIEIIGQPTDLVITSDLPESVTLSLRAPTSIWTTMLTEKAPVRALIDLSGVNSGEHVIPVQIQVGIKPVEVVSYSPRSVDLTLEKMKSQKFDITVITRGLLPAGYQAEEPQLSETSAMVSGAGTIVDRVSQVRAVIDLSQVTEDINETITLQPVDANGVVVRNVTVYPGKITLIQSVVQRGGYRNVVVKVVTSGQVNDGFRLTNISVFPPTLTVFSEDPAVVDAIPGYIETQSVDLTGKETSFEQEVELQLPQGLVVIGNPQTMVDVGIEPVQSSVALSDVRVEAIGLATNLSATILPEKVNVIISGPVPMLESILINNLRVLIDLTGLLPGEYTLNPQVSLNIQGLTVESISPASFEIVIK
jgi:YbbR domain-containing protein